MTPLLLPIVVRHDYYSRDVGRFHIQGRRDDIMRASRMEQKIEEDDGFPPASQPMQPILDRMEGTIFQEVCNLLSYKNPNATAAIRAQYPNMRTFACEHLMITYAVIEKEMFNLILLLALDHPDVPRRQAV